MSVGFWRNAAVIVGLLLLASVALSDWQQLNSGTSAELRSVHSPEGTLVRYAAGVLPEGGGAILKTTNRGDTWVLQTSGTMSGLNSVYFKDNNHGYAVGDFGAAIRTTDGGATWIPMTIPGTNLLTYVRFPENGMVGYIGVYPRVQAGRVLKTTDGGDNWAAIAVGGPMDWSYSCGFANDSIGVIVGGDGLVLGIDGYQDAQTNADLVAVAFAPDDPNQAYLIGNDSMQGVIRYTDDGGATPWDSARCWPVSAFFGVTIADSSFAYVCGAGGRIDVSVQPHDFYRTTTGVTADMHGVCFPNGADTGYAVGAGGVVLRTYDGGRVWIASVAEEKGPAIGTAEIRVVSNPSRRGVAFHAAACVDVVVFDAAGRVVKNQTANRGLNFLPLSRAGVYVVKVTTDGFSMTQKLVVER